MVRVGVVVLPQYRHRELATRFKALQDMGFAHGWTYDHLSWRSLADQDWFATVPSLAVAALATTSLKIGTWVMSPNFRHPVALAKELMSLDDISDGRFIAGIGAGGDGFDATVLGQDPLSPRERADRLDEFITLTDLLLRQPVTNWQGQFFQAVDARMVPGCVQSPRLPLIVAANGKRTMRTAARAGSWATTGEAGVTAASQFAWWQGIGRQVVRFEEICGRLGVDPQMPRYLSLDAAPVFSLRTLADFIDAAGRADELGFTDVVTHWPRPDGAYAGDAAVLEQVAGILDDVGNYAG